MTPKCVVYGVQQNLFKKFDENFSKSFENTSQFCGGYSNKFCQILQKGVYPYETQVHGWLGKTH